jgi:hypothetical protein
MQVDIAIDQKTFDEYLAKNDTINNERIRPDNENFFDALLTIDMNNDADGKQIIETIKVL